QVWDGRKLETNKSIIDTITAVIDVTKPPSKIGHSDYVCLRSSPAGLSPGTSMRTDPRSLIFWKLKSPNTRRTVQCRSNINLGTLSSKRRICRLGGRISETRKR